VAGFGLGTVAIVASAMTFDLQKVEPARIAVRPAASVNPLAPELARCQALRLAAQTDASCNAIWAENRRRFFDYRSGHKEMAATPPQASAPKIEDR
jgi:conjugative transfer region protein TrbK